jgi:hypothetical protein
MEAGDELLFVCAPGVEDDVRTAICAAPGDQPRVGDFASTLTSEPVGQ